MTNSQSNDELVYSDEFWNKTVSGQTITLTSKDTMFGKSISIFEKNIRGVKFKNTSDSPNTSEVRGINIRVKDADPSATDVSDSLNKLSNILNFNLNVVAKNDNPVFSSANDINFTEGSGETLLFANASISDPDGINSSIIPQQAIIQIAGGHRDGEDILGLETGSSVPAGLSGSFNAEDGTFTITASSDSAATFSDLQSMIRKIVYNNSSDDPSRDARDITVIIKDDNNASSTVFSKKINVAPVNDNPSIDLDGTEGNSGLGQNTATSFVGSVHTNGVTISPNAKISDLDGDLMSQMVVTLSNPVSDNNSSGIADTLGLLDQGNNLIKAKSLTLTSTGSDTVLSISGSASTLVYE